MVSHLGSAFSLNCLADRLDSMSVSSLLNSGLSRICGSTHGNDIVVLDRVKRKNSVRRMSIIEDGEVAEVLYLIPKQSMMEQLPFINPNDYILCEKLASIPAEMSSKKCQRQEATPLDVSLLPFMPERDQSLCLYWKKLYWLFKKRFSISINLHTFTRRCSCWDFKTKYFKTNTFMFNSTDTGLKSTFVGCSKVLEIMGFYNYTRTIGEVIGRNKGVFPTHTFFQWTLWIAVLILMRVLNVL